MISTFLLTIIQSKLLQISVCLQFRSRTFGNTQGNGLELPVNVVNVAWVQKENMPDRKEH